MIARLRSDEEECAMSRLEGRVALITGGARGQGRAHALALAEEGADIVVCDIAAPIPEVPYPMASGADLEETVRLVEKLGRRAVGVVADMRDTDEVQAVVDRAVSEFGRIDILVAQHGVISFNTIDAMSDEQWSSVLDTNLTGIFKVLRAVIPHMRSAGFGRIIATSSMAGRQAHPNLPHYVAAKWGIIGLVKACALENASYGITANAICPAGVATDLYFNEPMYRLFCPDIENPTKDDFERRLREQGHGLNGRPYLEPDQVSGAVVYLATDLDGVITGQVTEIGLGMPMSNSA
jgi:SDR family mycofactocin-dependent oxidoreductase